MKLQVFVYSIFAFLFFAEAIFAAKKRDITSIDYESENKTWVAEFIAAQAALDNKKGDVCKKFKNLDKKKAPTNALEEVLNLRVLQACSPNDFHLDKIKTPWLKKEAIFFGLKNTNRPEAFLKYYKQFQKLDYNSKLELEYLQRSELFKKILKRTKGKGKVFQDLLAEFPSFYVDYNLPVPEKDRSEAAYGLRMQRRFSEAQNIYLKILSENKKEINKSNDEKKLEEIERAYESLRLSYRVQEQKQKGIQEYVKGYNFFKSLMESKASKTTCELFIKIAVQQARDIWTEGNVAAAEKLLLDTKNIAGEMCELDKLYWVLGRMQQDKSNFKEAIDYFVRAKEVTKDPIFKQKLIWLTAWNNKKINKFEEAITNLEELAELSEDNQEFVFQHKALFWKSQILKIQGKTESANDLLKTISKDHEFGYYGRISLLNSNPSYWSTKIETKPIEMDKDDEVYFNVKLLSSIQEKDIASEYIQSIWLKQKSSWRKKLKNKIYLLSLNHEAQLYKENQQYLEIFDDDDKREILEKHAHFLFPMPHIEIAEKQSEKLSVPKELIYSLMRQESLFDPNARSPADAFGLLQLIPRIAKLNEKKAGVSFSSTVELYKPEIIIPLGTAHLSHLLAGFNGSKLLTAAGYNAGVSSVQRWLKSKQTFDVLEFIEDIPYAETETYVKLVFRNLSFYVMINDKMNSEQKVEFLKSYFKLE